MSGKRANNAGGSGRDSGGDSAARSRSRRGFRAWYEGNRSDLRFLLVFGTSLLVFYLATLTAPVKNTFFPAYLQANAAASGAILRTFGQNVENRGNSLVSTDGTGAAIQIERGCDAVEPSALFVAAVLASPVALGARLTAAVMGTILLMLLNLVRIISLFWVRVHYPSAFETMHLDVWQALFIILALVLWAAWAARAARRERTAAPDATT